MRLKPYTNHKKEANQRQLINNYSPKAQLILLNNPLDEVNNRFSIFTRSDLNRIRKETIKKTIMFYERQKQADAATR